MEHKKKTLILLIETGTSKFVTRKWNIVNYQPNENYDARDEIIYNTKVLKCNLCNFNDAYILVRGDIINIVHQVTQVAPFKNCSPLNKYITKIDETTKDNAEDVHLIMSMFNLIEYSSDWSETTGSS